MTNIKTPKKFKIQILTIAYLVRSFTGKASINLKRTIRNNNSQVNVKKGKIRPITKHEGPEAEYRHSSTLSLTSELYGVDG